MHPRKKRIIEERTEAAGLKLSLDDLLQPLATQPSTLQAFKQSTKALAPSSSAKTKTLAAPLPQRTQERLDREAAYEQTKKGMNKWDGTMERLRAAEHLSFPLQGQTSSRVHTEASMLTMNRISESEVAQRRAELRKMRERTLRAELKASRANKIKSRTYRRLKRKERERFDAKINEESDPEGARFKMEVDRARERATLRHKHTGKWAKKMKDKELDVDGRREIEDMLERGEKLRRRIQGVGSGESENDDSGTDGEHDDGADLETGVERIKRNAFDELMELKEEDTSIQKEEGKKGKGVFDMKFMKDAMARQQQAAGRVVDDIIQELGGTPSNEQDSDAERASVDPVGPAHGFVAKRSGGHIVYRPSTINTQVARPLGSLASDASSVTLRSTDLFSPPPMPTVRFKEPAPPVEQQNVNPWLVREPEDVWKATRMKNDVVVGGDSKAADKSKYKFKKQDKKRNETRQKANDDAVVDISLDNALVLREPSFAPVAQANGVKNKMRNGDGDDDHDDTSDVDNSELKAQERALLARESGKARGVQGFEQRDLVAQAFAGDNVVKEFEEVKRREVASDGPREIDTTLPGWGSWGGIGTPRAPPKPQYIKKIAGIDPSKRADFGKKFIIISEKRDKKAAKYLVKDLPYPYTSKVQFERAMEQPLGTEWNTRVAFQHATLPKVVMKPGIIINPLEKPL